VETAADRGARLVDSLEEACSAHYVILHAPYVRPDTHHLIGRKELACMPGEGHLVNAARGELVDLEALVKALDDNVITGAALDVYGEGLEPPDAPHPIWSHDKIVSTPHNAWYSERAKSEITTQVTQDMANYLAGNRPRSVTNPEALKDEPWFEAWAEDAIPSVSWQIERLRRLGVITR